jgi:hypothetical protein
MYTAKMAAQRLAFFAPIDDGMSVFSGARKEG